MRSTLAFVFRCLVVCAFVGVFHATLEAGTIMKLSLGGDALPDVHTIGSELESFNDGNMATLGEQDTAIDFQDFLSSEADILTPTASVTLDEVLSVGNPTISNGNVIQNFTGGSIAVLDASNNLLLSGMLSTSTLTGTFGPPGTGAVFTTGFGTVTGGSLAPRIRPGSLTLSINLTNVNGGLGFNIDEHLDPFTADASINIGAEPIPEPSSAALFAPAGAFCALRRRRCRR